MSVKHIDIGEFRRRGFLQEANRLFFHPHGLALEATTVEVEGWDVDSPRVLAAADKLCGETGPYDSQEEAAHHVAVALNALYPPGSQHLSGVWDYRDDPEGVIYGSKHGQDPAKVEAVAAERERHRGARSALFAADTDVEPIGWEFLA